MAIFDKDKKKGTVIGKAPEEDESAEEIKQIEKLDKKESNEDVQVREVPRCFSQTQINNVVLDNSLKLDYIISKLKD